MNDFSEQYRWGFQGLCRSWRSVSSDLAANELIYAQKEIQSKMATSHVGVQAVCVLLSIEIYTET